jgi:hypothetical protein
MAAEQVVRMFEAVDGYFVASFGDLDHQFRGGAGHRAEHEERRSPPKLVQGVQKRWRRRGVRAIVEGEGDVTAAAYASEAGHGEVAQAAEGSYARQQLGKR